MKQLSKDQIQELFELVERNAIKYYDVQLEIVDHYATAIEEIWEKEPDLSFYHAQSRVYKEFWDFKTLEQEKRMSLEKQYKLALWNDLKSWFSFPKILFSGVLFLTILQLVSTNLFYTNILVQVIFYSSLIIALGSCLFIVNFKSKWQKEILKIEVIGTILSIPNTLGILAIQCVNIEGTFPINFMLSSYILLWILCQIISYQIFRKNLEEVRANYLKTTN